MQDDNRTADVLTLKHNVTFNILHTLYHSFPRTLEVTLP